MATLSVRIPDEKKLKAQVLANELGLSLSSLVNVWVNEFLRTKSVSASLDDTHFSYYDTDDAITVDEDIDTVISYIEKSLDVSTKNG